MAYTKKQLLRRKLRQRIYWKKNKAAILLRAKIRYAEFRKNNPLPERKKKTKSEIYKKNREWKLKNIEKTREYVRKSYWKRKSAGKIKRVKYDETQKKRHDLYVQNNRNAVLLSGKKRRENLSPSYLKHALKLPAGVYVSKELLDLKAVQLSIHRALRR